MGPEFFWYGGMWIFPVIGIIVILFVVYLVFGRGISRAPGYDSTYCPGANSGADSALDILRTRYAKGEITKAEYDSIRKDLL